MPKFSMVLGGYDPRQVDEMVAKLEGTLGRAPLQGPPVTLKLLEWTSFSVALRGYDRFEVDGAMRRYRRELAALEGVELTDDEPDGGLSLVLGEPEPEPGHEPEHRSGPELQRLHLPLELREEIRREHGLAVRWRGYDRHQVEQFVVRIWGRLGRYSLRAYRIEPEPLEDRELDEAAFDIVLRGYDMAAVHRMLADYRRRLTGR
ncbi:hypothetical protein [uncultured Thermomonospora sp.]|uniref:hypothetical protein n=1 Tax=uncultured Thermomonospora sp. TaxID=671175 RepID=UPI00259BC159|nr:hypothetical protein [uncultured Thermomonospora sp.]